MTLYDNFVA